MKSFEDCHIRDGFKKQRIGDIINDMIEKDTKNGSLIKSNKNGGIFEKHN